MKGNLRFFLLMVLMVLVNGLHAQEIDAIIIPPPQTAYIADFFDNPNLFKVIVTNKTTRTIQTKIGGKLVLDGAILGESQIDQSRVFDLQPGANTFNAEDVFRELARGKVTLSSAIQDILRTGQWPSGLYDWCVEVKDATTNVSLLPSKCKTRFVTAYQVPTLTLPMDNQIIRNPASLVFRWLPISPSYQEGSVFYEISVFEVKNGQTPMQAFQTNFPIIEQQLPNALSGVWPAQVPIESGQYVWTVRAKDKDGRVITFPTVYANPTTFSVIKAGNTEGVSRLTFDATFPTHESEVTIEEAQKRALGFEANVAALSGSSLESSMRLYMIEKKAGYYTRNALLQAIDRDKVFYKSPVLRVDARKLDVNLSDVIPDSLAGKAFAWLLRVESAGKTYDSDIYTFKYNKTGEKPELPVQKNKFDCRCKDTLFAPALVADRKLDTKWQVGDTVEIGRIPLKIMELDGNSGKGMVLLPYAEVGVAVAFDGLKANAKGQVFAGSARILSYDIANNIAVRNLKNWNVVGEQMAQLDAHLNDVSASISDGLKMPFSLKKNVEKLNLTLPFDLLVTDMRLAPTGATLDLAMIVPNEDGTFIKFGASGVEMRGNGFSLKNLHLNLLEDVYIKGVNGQKIKLRAAGADGQTGSYIAFDCSGFRSFNLQADYTFDPQVVQAIQSPEVPLNLAMNFNANNWGDFLITTKIADFRLKSLPEVDFYAKNIVFDKSQKRNDPLSIRLSETSKIKHDSTWQGFFADELGVRLSANLLPNMGNNLTIKAQNMLLDSSGLSTQISGKNLTFKTNDWAFAVDSLGMNVAQSRIENVAILGKLAMPYLMKQITYHATMERGKDNAVAYKFAPEGNLEMTLWKANLTLLKGSNIVLGQTRTATDTALGWHTYADLDAEASFRWTEKDLDTLNTASLKSQLGISNLAFEMPKFILKGLKINHPDLPIGQPIGVDRVEAEGVIKLGGVNVNLLGVDFEEENIKIKNQVRKGRAFVLHLSKGIDFDCKIWSVRSKEDSTKWEFAKVNMAFATPKFECADVQPTETTEQTAVNLKVGQEVKVGTFSMKIERLASPNTEGVGTIRVPYLGSSIKVNFNADLKVNQSGVAFAGAAVSQVNPNVVAKEAFTQTENGLRTLNINALNVKALDNHLTHSGKEGIQLPLSLKKSLGKLGSYLPFDVLLTHINFSSSVPTMSLAMLVPNPSGDFARFVVPSIAIDKNGFNFSDLKMHLAHNLTLGKGLVLRGSETGKRSCESQFSCDGFKGLQLDGFYQFDTTQFRSVGNVNHAAEASFVASAKNFNDFIGTGIVEPMTIKGIKGSELWIKKASYDHSKSHNSKAMVAPASYKGTIDSTWQGWFVEEFGLKMPSIFPNDDKILNIQGKNLLIDSTGVTSQFQAVNVFSMGNNSAAATSETINASVNPPANTPINPLGSNNGWGMTVDTMQVFLTQSKIDSASLVGSIDLPFFSNTARFEGAYVKDSFSREKYRLATRNDVTATMWRADVSIGKGAELEVAKNSKNVWERRAKLDAEIGLNCNTNALKEFVSEETIKKLETSLGVNLLDFELPRFKLKGMKIRHSSLPVGVNFGIDSISYTGRVKVAGQDLNLREIEMVDDTVSVKGKVHNGIGLVLHMSKGVDFDLSFWAIQNAQDTNKWEFGKVDINFAIPKFECTQINPTEVSDQNAVALTTGQTVNVGSFSMKIETLAGANTEGVGTIRVPYLGSNVKVNFGNNFKVNRAGVAYASGAFSQVNSKVIPTDGVTTTAEGLRKISVNSLVIKEIDNHITGSGNEGIQLPLSLKKSLGRFGNRLPFDVLITHINFMNNTPTMSMAMMVPDANGGFARFVVPNINMNNKGFNLSDLSLHLAQDFTLAKGLVLRGSETGDSTSLGRFSCDGFKELQLDGYYQFDTAQFQSLAKRGTSPKANFTASARSLTDFIGTASVEPMSISEIAGSELSIKKAIYDRSTTRNVDGMKFPKLYKGKVDSSWTGWVVEEFTLKMPNILPNQDKPITLQGKGLLIDSTGVTGQLKAYDVLSIGAVDDRPKNGAWGLQVDTIGLVFQQNRLDSFHINGKVDLPILSSWVGYAGTGYRVSDSAYRYELSPVGKLNAQLWRANLTLLESSKITFDKINTVNKGAQWQTYGRIDAEMSVDMNTEFLKEYVDASTLADIKSTLKVDVLDFKLPKFRVKGLKINDPSLPQGRTIGLDSLVAEGDLTLAGINIALRGTEFLEDSVTIKGKTYKGTALVFHLTKGVDFDVRMWAIPSAADSTKLVFGTVDFQFSMPKFACRDSSKRETLDEKSLVALKVGQKVQISGGFEMTIEALADGEKDGKGTVRIPYLGTTYPVLFGKDVAVNGKNQIVKGRVFTAPNATIFDKDAVAKDANGVMVVDLSKLKLTADFMKTLTEASESATGLPISLNRLLQKAAEFMTLEPVELPFDVVITGFTFAPASAQLTGMVLVENEGKYLRFGVSGMQMRKNGISLDTTKCYLMADL